MIDTSKRVIITGGTGLVGIALSKSLLADGYDVIVLSRNPEASRTKFPKEINLVEWDARSATGWGQLAEGSDAIINLAGVNLSSGRWTAERKKQIVQSRANAGRAVVEAVKAALIKPQVVIQASGINYYGVEFQDPVTEDRPRGDDFLSRVCQEWEDATAPVEDMGVRRVIGRTGVVLDQKSVALVRMAMPFKFFVGGPVGSGRQWFPWIHLADEVSIYRSFIDNKDTIGAYNLVAPDAVTNSQFGKKLAKVLNRPYYFPVPAILLKLLFGEMSIIVLDGVQAVPKRLQDAGYRFKFPDVQSALEDIYRRT